MAADAAAADTTAAGHPSVLASVLAFERRGQAFCCPTADVLEIIEEPALDDPGYPTPLVAGVLLYQNRIELIPVQPVRELRGFARGIDTTLEREEDHP